MPPVPDLPRLIPLTARTVLDVGCGDGRIGAAYRTLNPKVRLLGIDIDPAMTAQANAFYDECVTADARAETLPFATDGGIDCIIYSAVLEQFDDPAAVLRRHARLLSPDGIMLICVSNIEHWSMARRLLTGGFAYEDSGLLDRRHLRWFSVESTRAMLAEAGLAPIDVQPRIFDEAGGQAFVETILPALQTMGVDPGAYLARALPLQHVWRVRPVTADKDLRMVIAGDMLAPIGGVSHLRVLHPLAALASMPGIVPHLASPNDPPQTGIPPHEDVPHIFILHRPALFAPDGLATVDRLTEQGWLVITEFDDHPDFLRGLARPGMVSFLGVHAVQTSTPSLAAVLRQRNPETGFFPNAIAALPPVRNFTDPRVLTVFYGALNREPDWPKIMDAINAVAAQAGDRLRFRVVHDEGFFRALQTPHKSFTPLCDYDTYMDLLGTSEISLMPLDDTPFNRAKSDLKFIEAGACRVASLASSVVYGDSIENGRTGLIFDDPEAFHRLFLRLVMVPDLALELGNEARRMVIERRMLADQVAPRLAWYRSLWARRAELIAARNARVADLRAPAVT
jgi:SAM-dependent methyltransferase